MVFLRFSLRGSSLEVVFKALQRLGYQYVGENSQEFRRGRRWIPAHEFKSKSLMLQSHLFVVTKPQMEENVAGLLVDIYGHFDIFDDFSDPQKHRYDVYNKYFAQELRQITRVLQKEPIISFSPLNRTCAHEPFKLQPHEHLQDFIKTLEQLYKRVKPGLWVRDRNGQRSRVRLLLQKGRWVHVKCVAGPYCRTEKQGRIREVSKFHATRELSYLRDYLYAAGVTTHPLLPLVVSEIQESYFKGNIRKLLGYLDNPVTEIKIAALDSFFFLISNRRNPVQLKRLKTRVMPPINAFISRERSNDHLGLAQHAQKSVIDQITKYELLNIRELGWKKPTGAFEQILAAFNDADPDTRGMAIVAFGDLGDTRALEYLEVEKRALLERSLKISAKNRQALEKIQDDLAYIEKAIRKIVENKENEL